MTPQDLRESIIYLAMQGKLTKQRYDDETSKELLRRYLDGKYDEPIDTPFEIPQNWSWVTFSSIVNFRMGKTPPRAEAKFWGTDKPWVSIADMIPYGHISKTKEGVTALAAKELFKETISPAGTLIMSFKLTVGRVSILNVDAYHNEAIISIYPKLGTDNVFRDYLYYLLPMISTFGQIKSAIKGLTLNKGSISKLPIPLPPQEEQKRIVERIKKLMPLVDEYERVWNRLNDLNERFPDGLKKSIIQYAMEGRLTKQLSSDGDAKDLLPLLNINPKVVPAESPHDIPGNWQWVAIGNLGQTIDSDSFSDGPFGSNLKVEHQTKSKEVRIIQLSNIGEEGWKDKNVKYTTYQHLETVIPRCEVHPGDFVIAKMMPAGRTIEVPDLGTRICLGSDAMKFVPNCILNKKFLLYAMRSQTFLGQVYGEVHGITRVRTTLNGVKSYVLPIPPLAEQQRIVETLDLLLALCADLNRTKGALSQ